ncbi:hypothetical protein Q7C_2149 [Methylophaga frappieri]|uniref:Uncharacterized protein n=1 Tax=Methylophaga frappieri (strain ATCC BAA-2434 / DSM 25690 / JAM7) TaxID=754477 RepID=I1YK42_METFJ|nr:hypothetical protein Q7C_2149 [Methylophaga frappieri]
MSIIKGLLDTNFEKTIFMNILATRDSTRKLFFGEIITMAMMSEHLCKT